MFYEISPAFTLKVLVALWGLEAETFDYELGDVLSFTKCRWTSWDNGSLSKLKISAIRVINNMDHELVHTLKRSFLLKRKASIYQEEEDEQIKKTKISE